MRYLSFFLWSLLTFGLCYFLDNPMGEIPALGKIVSPSHGFWRLLEGELPKLPEDIINDNLKEEVTVVWDENLIPHIYAQNDEDLYFVQGYVTASLRLWQMDFQNRAAEGRLSEIIGEAALPFDLRIRRLGLELGSEKMLAATEKVPAAKFIYEQYSKGVNAYLEKLQEKDWPVEYRLLDMKPEPWSLSHTMRIANLSAIPISANPNYDIAYTHFLQAYHFDDWNLLYGGPDSSEDPIVNAPGSWDFTPVVSQKHPRDIPDAPGDLSYENDENPIEGSNNWAVDSGKSASGNALLASDPHVNLSLPARFFLAHLHSPNTNLMGYFVPGVPSPIGGYNENIAYGATSGQRDLMDWYKVKLSNPDKGLILVDGEEVATTRKIEKIKVRGREPVLDTLYYSPFGVIAKHSELTAVNDHAWACRWIGQDTSRVGVAVVEMSKSKNWKEFVAATDKCDNPHFNWAYADIQGNIGIRVAGKVLARQDTEGLFLRDGTRSENIWTAYIPVEHTIEQFNPERGFVSSANQFPVDSTYPYVINAWLYESKRNRRINQVLEADSSVTVEDMKQLQLDNFSMEAFENLEYFLSMLSYQDLVPGEKEIYDDLKNWNFVADPGLTTPVYYIKWRDAIQDLAWDELDRDSVTLTDPSLYRTHKLLRERPNLKWWDIDSTSVREDARSLIQVAFKKMRLEINRWQEENKTLPLNWASFKGTSLTHLTQLKPLSRENLFVGGDAGIVNAVGKEFGPGVRMVVDLEPEGPKAWAIYPGGQSGNPGSMWYDNFTERWVNGEYLDLDLNYIQQENNSVFKSTFKPAPE